MHNSISARCGSHFAHTHLYICTLRNLLFTSFLGEIWLFLYFCAINFSLIFVLNTKNKWELQFRSRFNRKNTHFNVCTLRKLQLYMRNWVFASCWNHFLHTQLAFALCGGIFALTRNLNAARCVVLNFNIFL